MKKTGKSPAFYLGLGATLVLIGGAAVCAAKCIASHVKLVRAFASDDCCGCDGFCCCCDDEECIYRCTNDVECDCDHCDDPECTCECHDEE